MMIINMKRSFWVFLLCLCFSFVHAQKLTLEEIKKDVYFLASDSLEGRKAGSPGAEKAAVYIRANFKAAGLKLLGENGFQYFDVVTDVKTDTNNKLSFEDFRGKMGVDFTPFSFSSNATLSSNVVFAGYGFDINEDSLKWNDFKDVDVTGKWLMLLRGNPEPDNEKSKFILYSKERSKVLTAKDKGAAGVLFITGQAWDKNDELVNLYYDKSNSGAGIPVINIKRALANMMISSAGIKVEDIEAEINRTRKPRSFSTTSVVTATTELSITKARTENVVAMLPGKDEALKNEYIVVGAHYDHLGWGGPGSGSRKPDTVAIHNGADDNASGTSAVMALARAMRMLKAPLKRSVIFVAFSAEEMGTLGSSWFISHPLIDIKKIVLMLNFDMVGRMNADNPVLCIGGTGTAAEMDKILTEHTKGKSYKTAFSTEGYGPSDHSVFYAANIPVLYFNTGAHMDYHTPQDDANLINYMGIKEVITLADEIILDLAGRSKTLKFTEAGPKSKSENGYGTKVRLGIMPDFANTEVKGVGVGGVTPGGPAAHGGLLKGDVIIALNGKKVENIYEYMDRIKTFTLGQTISVDVMRGTEKKIFLIQL
jgi:aminopeptidase YwaD